MVSFDPPFKQWGVSLTSILSDNQASATLSSDNTFTATFNVSISSLLERFYSDSNSSRSSRNNRYSSSSKSNTSSDSSKPFEAKNIYMKS